MSTFVFFVQLEPDIDHLSPIVYRLNRDCPGKASVICLNPVQDIESDHRLRFLRSQGVKTIYLSQIGRWKHARFSFFLWLTRLPKFALRILPEKIWAKIYFNKGLLSPTALEEYFRDQGTKVVTVDEALPETMIRPILEVARKVGAKTIRVPTSNPVIKKTEPENQNDKHLALDFQLRPQRLSSPEPLSTYPVEEKVMGCMRYCEEWERINTGLLIERLRSAELPNRPGKLKVLIFERSTQGFRKDHSVVKKIQNLDFCDVVFRSRPRIIRPRKLFKDSIDDLPSALLIQWADVVVCSVSSIALNVLHHKKILLYAKFIAPHESTTYEEFGACWKVDSEEELIKALRSFQLTSSHPAAYSDENVKAFLTQTVYLGDPEFDVLGNYSRFYQSLCSP